MQRGYSDSVRLYARFSQDLRSGRADEDTPLFVCGYKLTKNNLTLWVSVGDK